MPERPNIVFLLADQLRAASLPLYGGASIATPHLDRLASQGAVFDNCVSTCPVCTPYRSMLVTGRHPQTTGHVMNFVATRHSELSIADAFAHAGYRTGWIGKWHLHTGSFPMVEGKDFVPEGRDRLGFEHWRGYNFHTQYFNGWVNAADWRNLTWEGYETEALNRYAFEFMENSDPRPFLLFLSPHQPHGTGGVHAPESYYRRLPETLELPANVPAALREPSLKMLRHYLAMTLALDDMAGELLEYLDRSGRAANTLFIFTSDHGSQVGAQGIAPWMKMRPYEESLRVPLIARWPGRIEAGARRDLLLAPVDFFPTLCSLCGVPIPRTVEGLDLSGAWLGRPGAARRDAALTMNFSATFDFLQDGAEWRGIRTPDWNYARWLDGRVELFDLRNDPLEMRNLAEAPEGRSVREEMEARLADAMAERKDTLGPCSGYRSWFDFNRRVVRNAHGALPHPESEPDWSLLR